MLVDRWKKVNQSQDNPFLDTNHHHHQTFRLTLLSYGLFFASSVLYVYLSFIQWEYEKEVEYIPSDVLAADDGDAWVEWGYQDDFVFQTPISKTWISEYTMVYFSAALGFVLAGCVDFYQWRDLFGILMILAASFGLASACYGDSNASLSTQLNVVSVHLWLLDALTVIVCQRMHLLGCKKIWFRMASVIFVIGTLLDAVLSWFYLLRNPNRVGIPVAISGMIAASFWMVAATIYIS